MKTILFLLLTSLGIGGAACLTNSSSEEAAADIIFKQEKGVAYFYAPKTGEILFLEHDPAMKIKYKPGQKIGYDLSNGKVTFQKQDGTLTKSFSTKSSGSGEVVYGIGIRRIVPGNYDDDDIFARDCGCFNGANPPMVEGQAAECSNNNPTLSTGCSSGGSTNVGMTIMATGASGGGGTSCSVTCGAGAYACCIKSGSFDVGGN